ncbi:MAG: hypothetical protein SPG40_07945 [Kiritimatiellia bacterium]|nr:hypothetical protein [Kiritimatiellia bacterium]
MRSKASGLIGAVCIALSASADRAHDLFEANRDVILAQPITVCGEVAFSVGRARSSRNRGDAVGYAKAAEQAKWNLGERHRATAAWPSDIMESERENAWLEYRSLHPERFSVVGMQRILTKKTPPDNYMVVIAFPANQVNVPEPTPIELKAALDRVRERKRLAEERARAEKAASGREAQTANPPLGEGDSAGTSAPGEGTRSVIDGQIEKHDGFDEGMML